MKHKKTVPVPATTREIVGQVTCDLCKAEIKDERFEVSEVTVSFRKGSSFPEGGFGTKLDVDMCGTCFEEKLVPWLQSQGAEPVESDWDW